MSISFSGLVSGLDTSSWVDAMVSVRQTKVTTLQSSLVEYQTTKSALNDTRSKVSTLRGALEKLTDAKFGGTFDLFALSTAKSSNDEVFTATVSPNAKRQKYDISVEKLATYTKATSRESASSVADDTTLLKNLGISAGSLTAYVNGHRNTVNITADDTFGNLRSALQSFGISVQIDEAGVVNFSAQNEGDAIHIGATTDTSNFASMLGLERREDGTYSTSSSVYKANAATKITAEDAGFNQVIKTGTFTIGNAEFTIDENTTLSSLLSDINSNENAQAYAYWDSSTGKLSLTSTKEGASFINIEAGTSNFTDVMGFTNSTWDEDGNLLASSMYTSTQEIGDNASFTVNGIRYTSASNTVTSDISRMTGVTLNLKRVNTEEDGKTTLSVERDTSQLREALKNFVDAYNDIITNIDEVTARDGELSGETSLTSLKNTLRTYAMGENSMNGGVYKLLADIGISTSGADASNLDADIQSLVFDEKKFLDALDENPESVKAILSGDNGIFNMMESTVEQTLKVNVGFFDVKTSTLDSDIKKVNEKITKQNKSIDTYRAQLEKKFKAMEEMIASMQQNYSSFLTSGYGISQ